MDDGDNYNQLDEADYDTFHNDYPYMNSGLVFYISTLRSTVGDLVPPTYDYWTEDHAMGNSWHNWHISLIWITFGIQILVLVVFFLNFLIAIVNDAYENVNENFLIEQISGRCDLNGELLRGQTSHTSKDNELIVMSTKTSDSNDSNWQGITRQIKKRMDHTDKQLSMSLRATGTRMQNWISDVEDKVN